MDGGGIVDGAYNKSEWSGGVWSGGRALGPSRAAYGGDRDRAGREVALAMSASSSCCAPTCLGDLRRVRPPPRCAQKRMQSRGRRASRHRLRSTHAAASRPSASATRV